MKLLQASSQPELARCAAELSVRILSSAIEAYDEAVWVLAGGSTPLSVYIYLRENYGDYVLWNKIWFLLGDERHVELSNPDSNWQAITQNLISKLAVDENKLIAPVYSKNLNEMAEDYMTSFSGLPKGDSGLPRFDLVWLGIGEDGHTLSLFPGQDSTMSELIIPVKDSPKPPTERISLSFSALNLARQAIIIASGESKAKAVKGLIDGDKTLPIVRAVAGIEEAGGDVTLIAEKTASRLCTD